MDYKYIAIDFGKVMVGPTTGSWDITPKLLELIDINTIDMDKFRQLRGEYNYLLLDKTMTREEEEEKFYQLYKAILSQFNIEDNIIKEIAHDRTYNFDKYTMYDNLYEELSKIKENYKLILLTDNMPCVMEYLEKYDLNKYFDGIYVSCFMGIKKNDKAFFDYPINDFNIKPGEALFIDDVESNLDNAKEKGFDVMLMDRYNKVKESKYRIINNLSDIFNK